MSTGNPEYHTGADLRCATGIFCRDILARHRCTLPIALDHKYLAVCAELVNLPAWIPALSTTVRPCQLGHQLCVRSRVHSWHIRRAVAIATVIEHALHANHQRLARKSLNHRSGRQRHHRGRNLEWRLTCKPKGGRRENFYEP